LPSIQTRDNLDPVFISYDKFGEIGMKRTLLIAFCLLAVLSLPVVTVGKPKPPKMVIQLYAEDSYDMGGLVGTTEVYLMLPDGSKAKAVCRTGYIAKTPCTIASFAPEKRVVTACFTPGMQAEGHCFGPEAYYADRKVNDITIYGASGKIVYRITGSWTDFRAWVATPPRPQWSAQCVDGTYSYSQEREGTCSDHGGVREWGRLQ
jgi:hypothetical protein